jgi:YHS domain-containing protein
MKYLIPLLFLTFGQGFAQETEAPAPAAHEDCSAGCADCVEATDAPALPTTFVPQTVCAISGEELEDRDSYFDYEGHRIYTCCKKCAKKVSKKPEQIALAMYAKGIALENLQTTCVVSGEELEDRDSFVKVYNKTIYTCCKKCKKKVAANPSKYLDVMAGRKIQDACAYSGMGLDPEVSFIVTGMSAGACCPKCVGKAKADPAAFFAKLEENNMVVENAATECAVMPGKPVSRQHFVTLGSKRYFFCCAPCSVMFAKSPEKFLSGEATKASMKADAEKAMGCATCAADQACADCS